MLSDMPSHVCWHCRAPSPIFGISTESDGVSPVGLFTLGDTFFFLPFSEERVTYSTKVPHRGRGRMQEIQPGKIFGVKNVLKSRGQACDEKDLLFVTNPVSAM